MEFHSSHSMKSFMCLSRSLPSTARVATTAATRGRPGDHDSRVYTHADAPTCTLTGAGLGPGGVHPGGVRFNDILN